MGSYDRTNASPALDLAEASTVALASKGSATLRCSLVVEPPNLLEL